MPDSRWSTDGNCTPGEDCTGGQITPDIRMNAADVTYAVSWQRSNRFTFDLMFNGVGSDEAVEAGGSDPLTTALLADAGQFRWTNHTYAHEFLGCVQDFSVRPWRCATDPATGAVQYVSQAEIQQQIQQNVSWAGAHGLSLRTDEVVTGEHSGLWVLPQQPVDNPNLAPALSASGIQWLGSDHSRDPAQRAVGTSLTVPRYPMNVFYNTATAAEEVDEYNCIYTSRADGGSGLCEDNPATMTCIAPLDTATGYGGVIVPFEARQAFSHVLANDPSPHFMHQSNLTEDRIAYPLLGAVLGRYGSLFATDTPLVSPRLSDVGAVRQRQAAWTAAVAAGQVSATCVTGS
jgi:hypothetical protein